MSIQDWGAIGEVVSAIGVVFTLIYLTTQIRQNTRQLQSQGHQGMTDSYNALLAQLLADDSLFKTAVRGSQDWESLTPFQQARLHLFLNEHLLHFRMAFQLHEKGAIDDDVYRSIETMHIRFIGNPGNRIWWKMVGKSLVEDQLAHIIDEKLANIQGTNRATTEAWAFYDSKNWRDSDDA
jgi:hypothetical protein